MSTQGILNAIAADFFLIVNAKIYPWKEYAIVWISPCAGRASGKTKSGIRKDQKINIEY